MEIGLPIQGVDRKTNTDKGTGKRSRPKEESSVPTRRSTRLAALDSIPDYREAHVEMRQQVQETRANLLIETVLRDPKIIRRTPRESSAPAPGSSRAIDADLSFLLGKGLGAPLGDSSTKATVMAIANGGRVPSFSKYSGTAEWRNCIFLWINYGHPNNEVQNNFADGGRRIDWYGGSNVYEESDIIQKLLRFSDGTVLGSAPEEGKKCVVLFVRKPSEPYICLGRLKYFSHDLKRHPVVFDWTLVDYDRLSGQKDFLGLVNS